MTRASAPMVPSITTSSIEDYDVLGKCGEGEFFNIEYETNSVCLCHFGFRHLWLCLQGLAQTNTPIGSVEES